MGKQLKPKKKKPTEEEQKKIDLWMRQFAELLIKNWREMSPEQRAKFTEKEVKI